MTSLTRESTLFEGSLFYFVFMASFINCSFANRALRLNRYYIYLTHRPLYFATVWMEWRRQTTSTSSSSTFASPCSMPTSVSARLVGLFNCDNATLRFTRTYNKKVRFLPMFSFCLPRPLFILLLSTLACCQPTELILGFFVS